MQTPLTWESVITGSMDLNVRFYKSLLQYVAAVSFQSPSPVISHMLKRLMFRYRLVMSIFLRP